ncbi:MAG TPA: hypothetical protein VL092_11250, partial [Chitinophagaceae bacterium]|nr:hypothetical protein [Chitinophagaceae bacterium]
MKKYFLLFAAGGLLTLASCGGDSTPAETTNVDSIAAVKADSIAAVLKAQSDSAIAMAAQATADSLAQVMREDSIIAATKAAAAKGAKKVVPAKKTTPSVGVTKRETPIEAEKPGGMKGSADQNS